MYWLARTERDATIAHYVEENRTVEIQELEPASGRAARLCSSGSSTTPSLRTATTSTTTFTTTARPACATRIDAGTGGRRARRRPAAARPAPPSGSHALALTADVPWLYLTLYFALGQGADRPITNGKRGSCPWSCGISSAGSPSAEGPSAAGEVRAGRLPSTRPDLPATPPERLAPVRHRRDPRWAAWAPCSAGWPASERWARVALGAGSALLGLVLGLLGTVLRLPLDRHRPPRRRTPTPTSCRSPPGSLLLAGYGVKLARGRAGAARKPSCWWRPPPRASLLGLLGKAVGLISQDNGPLIAFFLPLWLGLAAGLALHAGLRWPLRRPARSPGV